MATRLRTMNEIARELGITSTGVRYWINRGEVEEPEFLVANAKAFSPGQLPRVTAKLRKLLRRKEEAAI